MTKTRVIDCTMAAYELDAINVRLAELEGVVDVHHIVQGTLTFQGAPLEPLELPEKVISTIITLPNGWTFPDGSSVPAGEIPWLREKFLRDSSLEAVPIELQDTQAFYVVADGDEIPHPDAIRQAVEEYDAKGPRTLLTDHRQWYADWREPDDRQYPHPLCGYPTIGKFDDFSRVAGADQARCGRVAVRSRWPRCDAKGWHLSHLGDAAFMHRKLGMYSHNDRDNPHDRDMERLEKLRHERKDSFGRFDLELTDDLPATIHRFQHLLAPGKCTVRSAL